MFIGRKDELEMLRDRINNDSFELGVIYGQRRIGKTSLILEAVSGTDYIYFLAREDVYANNLEYFASVYQKQFGLPYPPRFSSFDELFESLLEYLGNRKYTIVIDELPFLAHSYPSIVSYLQGLADRLNRAGRPIKILLSGSDSSFMVDLLEDKAKPLYQRATFKMHVGPLLFSDAVRMLNGFANEDISRYLSIFGNRPFYLEKLDRKKNFDQNIIGLCFSPDSVLTDAPNITLPIGYSSNSVFAGILTALSKHKQRVKEIADELRMDSNAVSTYLGRMSEGESIEKRETFNGSRKTNYYEISDPFIRFYYRVIRPNLDLIERRMGRQVYESEKAIIDDIVAHGFEDVVNSFMEEQNRKGLLPVACRPFRRYVADNSKLGRSIEIDGLSESLDGNVLIAIEAKYRNKNVSLEVLEHLKESVSVFSANYRRTYYYLFAKASFSDDLLSKNDPDVRLVSLASMMQGNS